MILVTVGTEKYDFSRLFKILDELCEEGVINGEDLVAQVGFCSYQAKNYKTFDLIGANEFNKLVDEAEYIICHAGTGSVIPSLKKGKKVIMFPRNSEFGEHIDNHQYELGEYFSENDYALIASDKETLKEAIANINTKEFKVFNSNTENFKAKLLEYIGG